jgi:carbon-monoxide dehydrogenase catalytic subunit
MLATDLQDVLFGTPYPLQSEANLGVMKEDHVNIIVTAMSRSCPR